MIVGPIVAGVLFDVDMRLPYIVASAVLFLCFCMSLWQEKICDAQSERPGFTRAVKNESKKWMSCLQI
ncbi:hypothetical protein CV944_10825 [Geobacillus sp. WSUCF-018B]|nr:hypothetical protein CV944_10825 [Geobacillus sp. WSUCF-018B]